MAPRTLPNNPDAEASVLGGVLLNPQDALNQVLEAVDADDFYIPAHAEIFTSMLNLERSGQPIDLITLEEDLKNREKLGMIGGVGALAELASRVPTTANIGYHARIVRDKATTRKLIQVCSDVVGQAYSSEEPLDTFLDKAEQQVFELSRRSIRTNYTPVKELLLTAFNTLESRFESKGLTGIPTGFPDLDEMTAGFQRSDLIILAARPSMGKTALCLNIAQNSSMQYQVPVLMFSLEMSKEALIERILCSEARVDSQRLRNGYLDQDDWMKLTRAASRIGEAPIWIDDSAAPTLLEVRAKARRFRADKSIFTEPDQMGMIIVDYLQLVRSSRNMQSREQEVAEVSRGLKALAKETRLPVVALSQLRRAAEDRKEGRPQLSDLRESGAIEQDADVIAFIHRSPEDRESGLAELIIGKQRNGPVGGIPLVFRAQFTRFESRARDAHD